MSVRIALDASLGTPTCAVSVDGVISIFVDDIGPVEGYLGLMREALQENGKRLGDVDEIVSCVGPGSYMGVRTTVATCNALGLATGCGVSGVLSLDAAAVMSHADQTFTVAIPAGRQRWYLAEYNWQNGVLRREGSIRSSEDIPTHSHRAGPPLSPDEDCVPLTAEGVLAVAEGHRALLTQVLRSEVVPHLPPARVAQARIKE